MRWSDISFHPPSRTLRQFAGLWILFFGGIAIWQGLVRERLVFALVLAGLAATVGPLGLAKPGMIRPIYVGWMILVFPVGWALSKLLLALLLYGVFTPIGLFFKAIGRDALARRFRPNSTSYWSAKPAAADERHYFRQF